ncbi:MAG: helix-turn-helix domain-containing protein [Verrucomicrobiota bacterium]
MAAVGEQLRVAREVRGLGISEVANATNIKSDYIRAMEAGDWEAFGAPVYIKGFVRTYATHLKLDAAAVVGALQDELKAGPGGGRPPALAGTRQGALDWVMLQASRVPLTVLFPVLLGLAVLGALYLGARMWRSSAPAAKPAPALAPGLYQRSRPVAPAVLPVPTNVPAAEPRPRR